MALEGIYEEDKDSEKDRGKASPGLERQLSKPSSVLVNSFPLWICREIKRCGRVS